MMNDEIDDRRIIYSDFAFLLVMILVQLFLTDGHILNFGDHWGGMVPGDALKPIGLSIVLVLVLFRFINSVFVAYLGRTVLIRPSTFTSEREWRLTYGIGAGLYFSYAISLVLISINQSLPQEKIATIFKVSGKYDSNAGSNKYSPDYMLQLDNSTTPPFGKILKEVTVNEHDYSNAIPQKWQIKIEFKKGALGWVSYRIGQAEPIPETSLKK